MGTYTSQRWSLKNAAISVVLVGPVHGKLSGPLVKNILKNFSKGETTENFPRYNVGIGGTSAIQAAELTEYGCWCNFKTKPYMMSGHGEPVDGYDQACKQLVENYVCAYQETTEVSQSDDSVKDLLYMTVINLNRP